LNSVSFHQYVIVLTNLNSVSFQQYVIVLTNLNSISFHQYVIVLTNLKAISFHQYVIVLTNLNAVSNLLLISYFCQGIHVPHYYIFACMTFCVNLSFDYILG